MKQIENTHNHLIDDIGLELGNKLGSRWRMERLIGRGGSAHVYEAFDSLLARPVAIKVIVSQDTNLTDPIPSFLNEIRLLARLRHPSIISLYDASSLLLGNYGPVHYMMLEYLSALDLGTILDRQETFLPLQTVRELTLGILRGLHYLHRQGILHRDVKPGNILIGDDGVRLTDFDYAIDLREGTGISNEGSPRGSVGYIAPEQIRGEIGDFRADLYAVGTILYELLTGQLPFEGTDPQEIIQQQLAGTIRPLVLLRPDVDLHLATVTHRLLAANPDARYKSAVEALRVLDPRDPDAP